MTLGANLLDPIPADDLYARLEIEADATVFEIDLAWRRLMRNHHPDVGGDVETAKRINIAHDWLSDAASRARYNTATLPATARPARPRASPTRTQTSVRRPTELGPRASELLEVIATVAQLSPDQVDRLAAQAAWSDAHRRFRRYVPEGRLPAYDWARVQSEQAIEGVLRYRDAVTASKVKFTVFAYVAWLVAGDTFLESLTDPASVHRANELFVRNYTEAMASRQRYGPNDTDVASFLARVRRMTRREARRLLLRKIAAPSWSARHFDANVPGACRGCKASMELAAVDAAAALPTFKLTPRELKLLHWRLACVARLIILRNDMPQRDHDKAIRAWNEIADPDKYLSGPMRIVWTVREWFNR